MTENDVLGLMLIIPICVMVIIFVWLGKKRDRRVAESRYDELRQSIEKIHMDIFGKSSTTTNRELEDLHQFAKDRLETVQKEYMKKMREKNKK